MTNYNELQAENDELRARVGELEALLKRYNGLINDEEIDLKGTYIHLDTGDTLTKSPTQSLNDLKADAVVEVAEQLYHKKPELLIKLGLDVTACKNGAQYLFNYAGQLRNQTSND